MGAKVVIVDNCPTRSRQAAERLKALGCEVLCAQSAYGALNLLDTDHPDLVIVNWSLEDMFLHEFAEHAKHLSSDCVLLVSFDRAHRRTVRGLDDPYIDGWLPYDGGDHVWASAIHRAQHGAGALPV